HTALSTCTPGGGAARSSLPGTSDPRPRSRRQSIPIGHALGNGLVQPIFRPASQRSPLVCFPSLSRRDAGLKMLCVMFYTPRENNTIFSCDFENYFARFF